MLRILPAALFVFFLACAAAPAQTTEADIAARLVGKPLLLRGFWANDKLKFHADGSPAEAYEVRSFTESAIDVTSVKLKGNRLEIEGQRVGLAFDRSGNVSRLPLLQGSLRHSPEKMSIEVEGSSGSDYEPATRAIFAEKLAEIAGTLPAIWQPYARQHFLHQALPAGEKSFFEEDPAATDPPLKIAGSIRPPRVLHGVDPSFSQAGRQRKFSGESVVYLWVDPSGEPEHIFIATPLGLGLDERAVAAIQQYKFVPASLNGTPVTVELYISVNFHVF